MPKLTKKPRRQANRNQPATKADIAELRGRINVPDGRVLSVERRIDSLEMKIDRLVPRIANLEADMADVKLRMDRMEGKLDKIIVGVDRLVGLIENETEERKSAAAALTRRVERIERHPGIGANTELAHGRE